MKTSSKDFVVKVEMAAWFYIRRANERTSEQLFFLWKNHCVAILWPGWTMWEKGLTQCGIKWTPSVPLILTYTYSTWDGIIIWKAAAAPYIHIYSTENLLLLLQTSKENLELYFLSVVNRPKWVGKSIHKNQQKKNASFFKQNVVTKLHTYF